MQYLMGILGWNSQPPRQIANVSNIIELLAIRILMLILRDKRKFLGSGSPVVQRLLMIGCQKRMQASCRQSNQSFAKWIFGTNAP